MIGERASIHGLTGGLAGSLWQRLSRQNMTRPAIAAAANPIPIHTLGSNAGAGGGSAPYAPGAGKSAAVYLPRRSPLCAKQVSPFCEVTF